MESHIARFRIKLGQGNIKPAVPSAEPALPIGRRPGKIPTCNRCRRLKKKCSRTLPECEHCQSAAVDCSLQSLAAEQPESLVVASRAADDDLRGRLAWLEGFVHQRNFRDAGRRLIGADGFAEPWLAPSPDWLHTSLPPPPLPPTLPPPPLAAAGGAGGGGASNDSRRRPCAEDDSEVSHYQASSSGSTVRPAKRARVDCALSPESMPDATDQGTPDPYSLEACRTYVNAYFHDVSRTYPFLDRDRILATLEAKGPGVLTAQNRDPAANLLYMVMANGWLTLCRTGHALASSGIKFDPRYKEIVSDCLEKESVAGIQVMILLALYSMSDPAGFPPGSIVEIVTRQAIRLGMTRRATDDEQLSTADAEQNHRLFWSLFLLDRMLAVSMGLPTALGSVNYNVPLPRLTVEEFASPERMEYTVMLQISRQIIQLRQIEAKIFHQIHLQEGGAVAPSAAAASSSADQDQRTAVADLRTEIEDWYSNGCLLKSVEHPDNGFSIHVTISWLAARYYNLLLLLYYPSRHNTTAALVSKGELLSLASKHLHANALRLRQRELPLNRATLCRLLMVCLVYLHCFMSQQCNDELLGDLDEVDSCVLILEAFPPRWTQAHRAAANMRQFVSLVGAAAATTTTDAPDVGPSFSAADWAWFDTIRVSFVQLVGQVMGQGSVFQIHEGWYTADAFRLGGESEGLASATGFRGEALLERATLVSDGGGEVRARGESTGDGPKCIEAVP